MPTHTRNKPRTSTNKAVHRNLNLVTPVLQGKDVEQLQKHIDALCKHYEFPWMRLKIDGEFGKMTAHRAGFVMELIGLDEDLVKKARTVGHLSEATQRIIRNPEKRSKADHVREEHRKARFKKLREQHKKSTPAAVDAMLKYVGVHEEPAESNMGPFPITEAEAWFGLDHQPWCGCCAGFFLESPHGADLGKTGTWWPYSGSIRVDAEAGHNGLEKINPEHAIKGCVATFFSGGDDHVGLVRAESKGSTLFTVEGNTSSAHQDSDGGIIEIKERSFSEITCVALLHAALN